MPRKGPETPTPVRPNNVSAVLPCAAGQDTAQLALRRAHMHQAASEQPNTLHVCTKMAADPQHLLAETCTQHQTRVPPDSCNQPAFRSQETIPCRATAPALRSINRQAAHQHMRHAAGTGCDRTVTYPKTSLAKKSLPPKTATKSHGHAAVAPAQTTALPILQAASTLAKPICNLDQHRQPVQPKQHANARNSVGTASGWRLRYTAPHFSSARTQIIQVLPAQTCTRFYPY